MAQFYGSAKGKAGAATRLGTKDSGMEVFAAGWGGKIEVTLIHNDDTGEDEFRIEQKRHEGNGIYEVIANGVLGKPAHKNCQ